jgi:hypothetical protein
MKGKKPASRGVGVLVAAFLVLAIVLGALLLRKYEDAKAPPPAPATQEKTGSHPVVLFFAAESGDSLVREGREIAPCDEVSVCLEDILEELINGPVSDLAPVLPAAGMFNSVKLEGDVARVDFARELLDALPSGSSSEMMAAYAVVNSLALNYPQVRRVQFTLDGAPLETLKGHLDTRSPLIPDFSLEKSAEPTETLKGKKQ